MLTVDCLLVKPIWNICTSLYACAIHHALIPACRYCISWQFVSYPHQTTMHGHTPAHVSARAYTTLSACNASKYMLYVTSSSSKGEGVRPTAGLNQRTPPHVSSVLRADSGPKPNINILIPLGRPSFRHEISHCKDPPPLLEREVSIVLFGPTAGLSRI
jgi:hypothetical protein